jgi:hypothetical protein
VDIEAATGPTTSSTRNCWKMSACTTASGSSVRVQGSKRNISIAALKVAESERCSPVKAGTITATKKGSASATTLVRTAGRNNGRIAAEVGELLGEERAHAVGHDAAASVEHRR